MKKIDMVGRTFGRLTVLGEGAASAAGKVRWDCICGCGTRLVVDGNALRSGRTQSCGCKKRERLIANTTTHGMSKTSEYAIWIGMKDRCTNEKHKDFESYGGRGIRICERWLQSFEFFIADMGRRPSADHSIDRRDNDGHYEPSNCHWATRKAQARNRRSTVVLTVDGETRPLAELAEAHGLSYGQVLQRKLRGVPDELAVSKRHGRHLYLALGETTQSITDWSRATGIKKTTIQMRLRSGWPIEKALTKGAQQ